MRHASRRKYFSGLIHENMQGFPLRRISSSPHNFGGGDFSGGILVAPALLLLIKQPPTRTGYQQQCTRVLCLCALTAFSIAASLGTARELNHFFPIPLLREHYTFTVGKRLRKALFWYFILGTASSYRSAPVVE